MSKTYKEMEDEVIGFDLQGVINKIHLGDSLELLKLLPDNCTDLVVTDPPYQIDNTKAGGNSKLAKSFQKMNDEIEDLNIVNGFNSEILDQLVRVSRKINMYFFCNKAQIPMYLDYFVRDLNCSFDIIKWVKTNAVPTFNNKYLSDTEYCLYFRKGGYCNPENYKDASTLYVDSINVTDKKDYLHPTIKPLDLVKRIIRNSSKKNDVIIDPFMGSGTTANACIQLDRQFIGYEIDPKYHEIACERAERAKGNFGLFEGMS